MSTHRSRRSSRSSTRWGTRADTEYDLCKRLARVHRHGRIREEYAYDRAGNFIEKRDGAGVVLFRNEIHENCLVSKRHLASGGFHQFGYDTRGRITEASTERHSVEAAYDDEGPQLKDLRDGLGVERRRAGGRWITEVFARYSLSHRKVADRVELTYPSGQTSVLQWDNDGTVRRQCANGTTELLRVQQGRAARRPTHVSVARQFLVGNSLCV